jgi:hypothetical protein
MCRSLNHRQQVDNRPLARNGRPTFPHPASNACFAPAPICPTMELSEIIVWGLFMLESEFKRQRAKLVRELADQTTDPFIKRRLLALASRYDDGATTRTPSTLAEFKSAVTRSEQ